MDYRSSGVDIDAGNEVVRRIKRLARSTHTPGVLSEIGSFGGLFSLTSLGLSDPVLVASADGVGTKLKLAFLTNIHDTIGQDLVNHCVNDILVQGARPAFFLDYLATGRLSPDVAASIVDGIARACRENGCALLGGETAEMPGFYQDGEYDLAGFIIGVVERAHIIDGKRIAVGDVLIGLPSNGLHTNGYSLARRIVFDHLKLDVSSRVPALHATVGEELLRTHRSYLPIIEPLLALGNSGGLVNPGGSVNPGSIKGMAHITGGGITDNLPRILPAGTRAAIDRSAWEVPALFRWLVDAGRVPIDDAYRTFNMGIGLIVACGVEDQQTLLATFREHGEPNARVIGRVVTGESSVTYV